jgi:hypothetical protein
MLDLTKLKPSDTASEYSGGTAHILPNERAKATFKTDDLINFLDGGKENTQRKKFIQNPVKG